MKKLSVKEIVENHKGKVVDDYVLISNFGYIVQYRGSKFDARRWANCYGSDCGWGVMHMSGPQNKRFKEALEKDLNNYELNREW